MYKLVLIVLFGLVHFNSGSDGKEKHVVKRAAVKSHWLWPGATVVYKFSSNLDIEYLGKVRLQQAMQRIEAKTCIKFKKRTTEPNYVLMQYDMKKGACKSAVGYKGNVQGLWISNPEVHKRTGYCGVGSIMHELGHTLGLFHEQSRPDRDNYVTINLRNLAPKYQSAKGNFRKVSQNWVDDRGVGYDYGSLMHYGRNAFAARGKETIVPKDRKARIGQRRRLSSSDIEQLNKMYNC